MRTIHGELLAGRTGSILIELAASWAIIMLITGLYLWWPRESRGAAGVLYPRLRDGRRVFWRDLHAVTGMWVSAFAMFLLITALPWTTVWGAGLKEVARVREPAGQAGLELRAAPTNTRSTSATASAAAVATPLTLDEIVRARRAARPRSAGARLSTERAHAFLARAQPRLRTVRGARARARREHRRGAE